MADATLALQQMISDGMSKERTARVYLQKGDYAVQTLEIPRLCSVELFSKDRVRILHSGKRNRPLFILNDGSTLVLREKLEIYYNTNNIQEAVKLMVRMPPSARLDVGKSVRISLFSYKPDQ